MDIERFELAVSLDVGSFAKPWSKPISQLFTVVHHRIICDHHKLQRCSSYLYKPFQAETPLLIHGYFDIFSFFSFYLFIKTLMEAHYC